jgi:hypothetical protein
MNSEHDEQARILSWAEITAAAYPELALLYAIPNGAKLPWKRDKKGKRFSPEAMRLKDEGLKAGVPDLCLPVARQDYNGLYIEMKYGRNKPTPAQIWWLDQLARQGYLAVVCWGAEEAIGVLREYLESGYNREIPGDRAG